MRFVRFLIAIVGSGAYLYLAVLGWGGFTDFFAYPVHIGLAVIFLCGAATTLFANANLSSGEREDRGNRWVIAALAIAALLLAYVPACLDRKEIWTFDGDVVRWIGLVLVAIGVVVRLWPVFVLGRRFSGLVAIQPGHTLVTTGIYSRIRNPSYLGLLITVFGWAMVFRSGAGLLIAASMLIPLVARMNSEERLLRSQFGDEYDAYCARTSRLIPGIY